MTMFSSLDQIDEMRRHIADVQNAVGELSEQQWQWLRSLPVEKSDTNLDEPCCPCGDTCKAGFDLGRLREWVREHFEHR